MILGRKLMALSNKIEKLIKEAEAETGHQIDVEVRRTRDHGNTLVKVTAKGFRRPE